ncbi:hypothetical protein FRZ67_18440 [Panacibacter ginsenosidivorans]|uniref:Aminoglycoside phosphotransferase domain-containing protein n=1 Tax=Panacibacter ginsenosidivorans TaxID=1813871 RepID=A0A5B8VDV9_9BACT|nr:hypothetical protein [Panacibacter ginsenosidivorans]QEC69193.1 hypothetical protein FRZ67_18440 [Panacibacter ginsenosidivorans]
MTTKNTVEAVTDNRFSIEEKVAFLKQPEVYPFHAQKVNTKETHMSWIFFVGNFVYKLKKPVRYNYLDHRTLASRLKDCRREIRLNKKLAEDIYIGLTPLTSTEEGKLELSGNGKIEEWLVKMNYISQETMLDHAIRHNCINEERLKQAALLLSNFYKEEPSVRMGEEEYKKKLRKEVIENYKALIQPDYKLPEQVIKKLTNKLLCFLEKHSLLFNERVSQKKIIEAHGDLRPEHVCLTPKPVIIDRLEFSRALRILDTAEELSYFAMECEMLGNVVLGEFFFNTYSEQTSDNINPSLVLFYKIKRACLRAYLGARHVTESNYKRDNGWLTKANRYVALAEQYDKILTT